MNHVKTNRSLHISWVGAGQRRVIAKALYRAGMTQDEIAKLLGVSQAQISRDVTVLDPPYVDPKTGVGGYDTDEENAIREASRG